MPQPLTNKEKGHRLMQLLQCSPHLITKPLEKEAIELIREGADLSMIDTIMGSPLGLASFTGHPKCVEEMIAANTPLDLTDEYFCMTGLMCAVTGNHLEIAEMLVKAGANPLLKDWDGETALEMAEKAKNKNPELIKLLQKAEDDYRLTHHKVLKPAFRKSIERGLPTTSRVKLRRPGRKA